MNHTFDLLLWFLYLKRPIWDVLARGFIDTVSLTAKTTLVVFVILQCLVLRHHLLDHFLRLLPYPLYNVIVPTVSLFPAALSNVCMFFPTGEATVSLSID